MTKILSIETSCDETSIAIVDYSGERSFQTLSHITNSQAEMHAQFGGVYPAMARREHQANITPLLFKSLQESGLLVARSQPKNLDGKTRKKIEAILDRDPEIAEKIILLAEQYKTPSIRAVAVTYGPGLEIALWTGFNTARALAAAWGCDLVPTNHMEGHIYASLVKQNKDKNQIHKLTYPSLALLISGGHTELVLMKGEHDYTVIGQTLDDAVGEAYDKSARLLGLPYPGGPLVSQQAELIRTPHLHKKIHLVRHGESEANKNKIYSGPQHKLTTLGISQAEKAGSLLKNNEISLVISSKLVRAVDTAKYINEHHNAHFIKHEIFNEVDFGKLTNTAKQNYHGDILTAIEDGTITETPKQIMDRCRKALRLIYTQATKTDGEIVLVAHGILLVCMTAVLRGATPKNLVSQCRRVGRMDNADQLHITLGQIEEFLYTKAISLPRPLLHSKDYNFSFSGLKTAVRTVVQKQTRISKKFKQELCLEFEEAVAEVLTKKTARAIDQYGIKNLVIGGGVSANTNLRREFTQLCKEKDIQLFLPDQSLSGDNALMINLAGYRRLRNNNYPTRVSRVKGNLKLN